MSEHERAILFDGYLMAGRVMEKQPADALAVTEVHAAAVWLVAVYQSGLMDPFVSLLEVHKLMYFLRAAGKVQTLNFAKGPYGPYAEKLRHVLTTLEGHWISGYGDGGDKPEKPIDLLPGALSDADIFLAQHPE